MANVSHAMKAKSDQLNYIDIGESELIITIESVNVTGSEQPISIFYAGCNNRPYKPSKGMIRLIAGAWGEESDLWVGKSIKLFGDPTVMWAGKEQGGLRIRSLSDIPEQGYTAFIQKNRAVRVKQTIPLLIVEPTANDLTWIEAAKQDIKSLDQIEDAQYREYIESFLNRGEK